MKTKRKEIYKAPEAEALDLKIEGVVCQSNGDIPNSDPFIPGGNPFSFPY